MRKPNKTAYDFLRQRLISGYYEPRTQLKEEHIAEELGVSRSPVRAALRRLMDDGLVVAAANRGMFVAEWTERDIRDIWSLRLLLEPQAAGLAAERASAEQIEEMRSIHERMLQALLSRRQTRIAELQAANYDFHTKIIDAAGSPRLKTAALQVAGTPMLIGTYYVMDEAYIQRSLNHHEDILSAIASREAEAASKAMWVHLKINIGAFFEARGKSPRSDVSATDGADGGSAASGHPLALP